MPAMFRAWLYLFCVLLLLLIAGCSRTTLRASERPTSRPVEGIGQAYFEPRVEAMVVPPAGWKLDPPKISDRHTHLAWISPSGDTAYGVIHARIPGYIPVGIMPARTVHNQVLDRVIDAMRDDQGEAQLLSKRWDPEQNKLLFVAEGGLYKVDSVLTVRGWSVWTLYVGRLREREPNPPEIDLAEQARQATRVGREAGGL